MNKRKSCTQHFFVCVYEEGGHDNKANIWHCSLYTIPVYCTSFKSQYNHHICIHFLKCQTIWLYSNDNSTPPIERRRVQYAHTHTPACTHTLWLMQRRFNRRRAGSLMCERFEARVAGSISQSGKNWKKPNNQNKRGSGRRGSKHKDDGATRGQQGRNHIHF